MTQGVYWDTSALVKLYAPEPDSSAYLRFLLSQRGEVILSHLHLAESRSDVVVRG